MYARLGRAYFPLSFLAARAERRFAADEHLYAHPLDFNCVVDANAGEVLYIGTLLPDFVHSHADVAT